MQPSEPEIKMMQLAFDQAALAVGNCQPNPAVGAVLVDDLGQVIGRGHTQPAGLNHAEVEAIGDAARQGKTTGGATMYVTLEPCCHHGRTPPCTEAIIKAGIKKVVIATGDDTAKVQAKSRDILRQNKVDVSFLPADLFQVEKALSLGWFFHSEKRQQPFYLLKWAQTRQGHIAPARGGSGAISNEFSHEVMHRLRSLLQATMVTPGTIASDRPSLTARWGRVKLPGLGDGYLAKLLTGFEQGRHDGLKLRVFLMPRLGKSFGHDDLDTFLARQIKAGPQAFFLYRDPAYQGLLPAQSRQVENYRLDTLGPVLREQKINSVMIEAGPAFSQQYLESGQVDGLVVFRNLEGGPEFTGGRGNQLSRLLAGGKTPALVDFDLAASIYLQGDEMLFFRAKHPPDFKI